MTTDGVVKSLVWKVLGSLVKHNGVSKPVLLYFESLLSVPRDQVLPCLVIRSTPASVYSLSLFLPLQL